MKDSKIQAKPDEKKQPTDVVLSPDTMFEKNLNTLADEERDRREEEGNSNHDQEAYHTESYRYFHPEEFEKGLYLSEKLRSQAQKLIDQGVVRMHQFLIGTENIIGSTRVLAEGIFKIRGFGFDHESYNRLKMVFDQTQLIYSECPDWDCKTEKTDQSYFGRTLCVHEVAGLLLMEKYMQKHNEIDATTPNLSRLMRTIEDQSRTLLKTSDDIKHDVLRLEPTLRYTRWGALQCRFKIGSSRLYQVQDLEEFYENMENEARMQFGKKTSFQLGRVYLDERSQQWYEFFSMAMQDRESREGLLLSRGVDVTEARDAFDLYGALLDKFMELANGMTIECRNERKSLNRNRENWVIRDCPLKLHLNLIPDYNEEMKTLDGVVIEGSIPAVFHGVKYAAWLNQENDTLNRTDRTELGVYQQLRKAGDFGGNLRMKIGRFRMGEFYHKVLPEIRKIAEVKEENAELVERYLPPEPSFLLYLDYEDGRVFCRAEAVYGRETFLLTDQLDWLEGRSERGEQDKFRDEETEAEILNLLLRYFINYEASMKVLFTEADENAIFDLLDHGLDELMSHCEVRVTDRFRRLGLRRHVKVRVGVSLETNLLNLSVTSQDVSSDELLDILSQYHQKKKFIRLKNGDFMKLQDNEGVSELAQVMDELHLSLKDMVKGKMHIPAYRSLYLDKMLEGKADVYADRDRHFRELIKGFKTISDSDYDVPACLEDTIRPYQREGYQWLRTMDQYGFGGILADEMGLGKTLQALACLEAVHEEEKSETARSHTSLVICPASLVYNWMEEVKKFAPSLRALAVTGSAAKRADLIRNAEDYDILVTSYDLLKRDIALYDKFRFRFEIIDEAQYIKNHNTAAAKSAKLIHADTRFALTGTPIENRLSELWSIFDYLMPGFLYEYTEFRDTFEKPIVKDEDEEALNRLRRMITPFILRRQKKDVLKDLPEKIEEIHYAGMESRQQKLYDAQVIKMRNEIEAQDESDFRKNKIQILAELMRIRQICCDPDLAFSDYHGGSCKTDMCMDLISSLIDGGHKALLFSQFTSMLEILKHKLDEEKIPYYIITGQTPKEKRLELVKQFNTDDTPVFLISLKAGGTGLNLTGADTVIHYDPWWNTAAEDQATDRAHRIGQTNIVTVYKLVVKGTIEEKIIELQNRKAKLAEDLLTGDVASSTFTREDLLNILD